MTMAFIVNVWTKQITGFFRAYGNCQIYGIGAALGNTEVVVSDAFLKQNPIEKGVMTLVLGLIVQFGVTVPCWFRGWKVINEH
jgi:hypothetical protein